MPKYADRIMAEGFEIYTPRSEGPQKKVDEPHYFTMTVRPSWNLAKELTFLIRGKVDRDQLAQMLKTGEGLDSLEFFAIGKKPGSKVYKLDNGKDTVLAFVKDANPVIEEVSVRKKPVRRSLRKPQQERVLAHPQLQRLEKPGEEVKLGKYVVTPKDTQETVTTARGFVSLASTGVSNSSARRDSGAVRIRPDSPEQIAMNPKKDKKKP